MSSTCGLVPNQHQQNKLENQVKATENELGSLIMNVILLGNYLTQNRQETINYEQ